MSSKVNRYSKGKKYGMGSKLFKVSMGSKVRRIGILAEISNKHRHHK